MLVAYTLGFMLFFIGASLIFKTALWIELIETISSIQKKELFFFILSGISLALGLLIIFSYNEWFLNPLIIVTLVGWATLIKSAFYMFFPKQGIQIFAWFSKQEKSFLSWGYRIIGSLYMLLGVTLLSYISSS